MSAVVKMEFDVDAARACFPSLAIDDGGVRRIYFDNPAGTQVPQSVVDAIADCLIFSNANQKGPFRTSKAVDGLVRSARAAMADLVNAPDTQEIVFGQSMTALAFHLARSLGQRFEEGDEIVVTDMDHDANVQPWLMMARDHGLRVRSLHVDTGSYEFDLRQFDELLNDRTRLVCIGGASNLTGTINDVQAVCSRARDAGALSFIDAVQSVPHIPTDVMAIGCDFLACSAYKFFGPHLGILWGRREIMETLEPYQVRPAPAVIPACFEPGTPAFELLAGATAAVDYLASIGRSMAGCAGDRREALVAGMRLIAAYEARLSRRLIDGLGALPGVTIRGISDAAALSRRVPTVAFTSDGDAPAEVAQALADRNIFVWHGHNYALELVRALDLADSGGVVRIGPVHYNTAGEIDELLNALEDVLSIP